MTVIYEYGAFPENADGHENFFTLSELTDEQVDEGRLAFINEKERRERLATIPSQVSQLVEMFVSGGGEPAKIEEAVLNVTQLQLETFPSINEPTQSEIDNLVTEWPKTLPGTNV